MENGSPNDTVVRDSDTAELSEIIYVPATSSLLERRPLTLKSDDTFGVFDPYGDVIVGPGTADGLYHQDMRHLSRLVLTIDGMRPLLLNSAIQDDNGLLKVDLTNPDLWDRKSLTLPKDTVHIIRSKYIFDATCFERIAVKNMDVQTHSFRVSLAFDADFADMFEVRGHERERRGKRTSEVSAADEIVFSYQGLDGVERKTALRFEPTPTVVSEEAADFALSLRPGESVTLLVAIACSAEGPNEAQPGYFFVGMKRARRMLRAATHDMATVSTSNEIFNEVLCRSVSDLHMLVTETEYGPYPYAGVPWFSTAFGRDGIITALQALWFNPGIAKGVLKFLAANQASDTEPQADAEPGKILHEMRLCETARLGEVPFRRYYGSVDATPLFVILAGMYWQRTGDLGTIASLWPHIEAALAWIDIYGDVDGDGFVEYARKHTTGLANQGWKDSHDSVFHRDGALAQGPIALAEVQGYVYAARIHGSAMALALGHGAIAVAQEQKAKELRSRVEESFWDEELGTYVLALDGDKKPCRVRASNAGHLLFCGLPEPERADRVIDSLLGKDFFCGWGIRTLANGEPRFNPMSYHNGSVWPHDNALIALGMSHYGHTNRIEPLFQGIFKASTYMDLRRLPELFCGFRRKPGQGPTYYPVACSPQAWASVVPLSLLQASLGLEFDSDADAITFRYPQLPDFLDDVEIRNLQLNRNLLDIRLRRHQKDVTVDVLRRSGSSRVIVTL